MDAGEGPEGFAAEPEADDGVICEDVGCAPEGAVWEGVAVDFVGQGGLGKGGGWGPEKESHGVVFPLDCEIEGKTLMAISMHYHALS